jgi:hypothetical protein
VAAISLHTASTLRQTLYVSDATSDLLEALQFTLREGACMDTARTGHPCCARHGRRHRIGPVARLRLVVLEADQRHTHAAPPGDDLDCQGDAGGRLASCCDHGDGPG